MDLGEAFAFQGPACARLGSPMYAELLAALTDDIEAGGVTAAVLAGHEDDPGPSALALRLLGSVHRLVLERRAGALAAYYPSVGGTWSAAGIPEFLALLGRSPDVVREWLDRPPQTNEVGRSGALYGGLLRLPWRLPVRLFEIGSSGGLNLNADRYAYRSASGVAGVPDSPVVLDPAWLGVSTEPWPVSFASAVGCDRRPIDVTSTEGRLALTAYVWPDQLPRLERLRGAFAVVDSHPVTVRTQPARDFVDGIELEPGHVSVLWHSIVWQYLDAEEKAAVDARIEELGSSATDEAPFARLQMEPLKRSPDAERDFLVVLQTWPDGESRVLGTTVGHGVPTTWEV